MAKRRHHRKHRGGSGGCAGRNSKGKIKKGYRVVRGKSCPVPVKV